MIEHEELAQNTNTFFEELNTVLNVLFFTYFIIAAVIFLIMLVILLRDKKEDIRVKMSDSEKVFLAFSLAAFWPVGLIIMCDFR